MKKLTPRIWKIYWIVFVVFAPNSHSSTQTFEAKHLTNNSTRKQIEIQFSFLCPSPTERKNGIRMREKKITIEKNECDSIVMRRWYMLHLLCMIKNRKIEETCVIECKWIAKGRCMHLCFCFRSSVMLHNLESFLRLCNSSSFPVFLYFVLTFNVLNDDRWALNANMRTSRKKNVFFL